MALIKSTSRPLTLHDYRELPETGPQYQLIEGDLHMSPAPSRYHQKITGNLYFILRGFLETSPLGDLYHAPFDVYLTDTNVYHPDIVFFSQDRLSFLTEQGAEGAPDLVAEVLSPKTARFDKGVKREIYARTGVAELWIIDPAPKLLKRYVLTENAETPRETLSEEDVLSTPLFPRLKITLSEMFKR